MTRFITLSLALALPLALSACKDDDTDDTNVEGDTDSDSDADTDTDTDADADTDADTDVGYTIEGSTYDIMAGMPVAEGLCVTAFNPDAVVTGGELVEMSTTTTDAAGAYSLPGIYDKPVFGILLSVFDCEVSGTTVMTSATPVNPADYNGLASGDVLSGTMAFVINADYRDGIDMSLAAMGYPSDITTDGALAGMVMDATHAPIEGAVVTGSNGIYYQDANPSDGLFTTAGAPNMATAAAAGAFWIAPGAGISTYSATYEDLVFPEAMAGSSAGSVMILPLIAE